MKPQTNGWKPSAMLPSSSNLFASFSSMYLLANVWTLCKYSAVVLQQEAPEPWVYKYTIIIFWFHVSWLFLSITTYGFKKVTKVIQTCMYILVTCNWEFHKYLVAVFHKYPAEYPAEPAAIATWPRISGGKRMRFGISKIPLRYCIV